MSEAVDSIEASSLLVDPRLERLFELGKEMNDTLARISAATRYLASEETPEGSDEVEAARSQLVRDLSRSSAEAKALLPAVDETMGRLTDQKRTLESAYKVSAGLVRIEGLAGMEGRERLAESVSSTKSRIAEIDNLILALDALQRDIRTSRNGPHTCPRCRSANVSYRISPSDLGFTLYRCDSCGNAWKITQFSLSAS